MTVEVTERQLTNSGFSLADREEWFLAAHPEWKGRTEKLLGVYTTCQADSTTYGGAEFEAAHAHVAQCAWCRARLREY